MDSISINDILGHTEIFSFVEYGERERKNYSYSITYDMEHKEVSRTEPSLTSTLRWGVEYKKN